ncbi:zinc c3hc4 type (ring finger) domain-containing protein [Cystoisospora suis]|uniref:E3 ubiquitin protein ligase n=1 Tax=Cystoisospora suis TaxID=483139 RepID=A0A2C6LE35_9APIC|nr:zinc c3hc4 type (ring finger) domain-containing protein [Cystoisospora suis]
MQHDQLKSAGTQMLMRNERMRKEKQSLIEVVRVKDEIIHKLHLHLITEEKKRQREKTEGGGGEGEREGEKDSARKEGGVDTPEDSLTKPSISASSPSFSSSSLNEKKEMCESEKTSSSKEAETTERKEKREEDLQTKICRKTGEGDVMKKREGEGGRPAERTKGDLKTEGHEEENIPSSSSCEMKTLSPQESSKASSGISRSGRRGEKEEEAENRFPSSKQEEAPHGERKNEVAPSKMISPSSPQTNQDEKNTSTGGPSQQERRDDVSAVGKESGQAPNLLSNSSLSAGGSVRTSRRPSVSLGGDSTASSVDLFEAAGTAGASGEGGGEEEAWKAAKLKIENDALRRRLSDYDQLDAEIVTLRQQYGRVSEELEEISKAFEERQTFCEHLIKQIKEKDEALAEQRSRNASFGQQQQMFSRICRLHDQKLLLLHQQYEQQNSGANCRAYLDALQQANARATIADQQREEVVASYHQIHAARDATFKEKEEALARLSSVIEANKALDASFQESVSKRTLLENELRKLVDTKADLEKRIEKLKQKEEKQDRKRAHTAALDDLSMKDLQLLKDENELMRRRLVCFVCNERFKTHIISKCGHMFCQACLEKNVKTRNRKCPHCKAPFDQKDIRKVYLDN